MALIRVSAVVRRLRAGVGKVGSAGHVAGRCVGNVGRSLRVRAWGRRPRFELDDAEKPRSLVVSTVLGAVLVGLSFLMYSAMVSPPRPPVVDGAGELYVAEADVVTKMVVTVKPRNIDHGRSHVNIAITFLGAAAKPVDWALVLYGDARFVDPDRPTNTIIPPAASIVRAMAGSPPFSGNPRQDVEVISGRAYPKDLNARSATQLISGDLPVTVASQDGATFSLALPRYGRVHFPPLFEFPQQPGAIDIGIPGTWKRPDKFEVDVDAGGNDVNQRIDLSSPDIADPTRLHWESGESVRAVLRRTDLDQDAVQQTEVFLLGAIVGAGASSVVVVLERLFNGFRVRARGAG